MKRIIRACIFFLLLLSSELCAAPTGRQLLEACQRVIAGKSERIDDMVCEWYVRPCDCEFGQTGDALPRVCLTDDVSSETLAKKVIEGLESERELSGKSANHAAAVILSRTYPCNVVNKHLLKDN